MIVAVILFWLLFILWALGALVSDSTTNTPKARSILLVIIILLLGLMCTGNPFAGITEGHRSAHSN